MKFRLHSQPQPVFIHGKWWAYIIFNILMDDTKSAVLVEEDRVETVPFTFLIKRPILCSAEGSGWLTTFLVGLSVSPVLVKASVFWSSLVQSVCKRSPNKSLRIDYTCLVLMKMNNACRSSFIITRPLKLKIEETFPKLLKYHFLSATFITTYGDWRQTCSAKETLFCCKEEKIKINLWSTKALELLAIKILFNKMPCFESIKWRVVGLSLPHYSFHHSQIRAWLPPEVREL